MGFRSVRSNGWGRGLWMAALLGVGLWPHLAAAQSQRLSAYDTAPAPDDDGFISLRGTITPGHLRSQFTLTQSLGMGLLRLRDPLTGQRERPVSYRNQTDLIAQVGLGSRSAVSAELPVVELQRGDAYAGQRKLTSPVIGDPRLRARYRLLGAVATRSGGRADGPGLGVEGVAYVPVGARSGFVSEGSLRGELNLLADFQLLGAGAGVRVGVRHRFVPRTIGEYRLRDAMTYGVGLKLPMPFWPALTALAEVNGSTEFDGAGKSPLELLLGARIHVSEWTVLLNGSIGLAGNVGRPDGVVSLGLRYAPKDSDSDGDGVSDDEDGCPFLAEDMDGFEDEDGCEDPDNDNDLIPDADDLCPNEEALEGMDDDEDGCTDGKKP